MVTVEQDQLIHLENIIARSQEHFYKIGRALKEIRDKRLYKLTLFETFETYTKARWEMGRSHAHRLIEAYGVIKNLSPIGDILPANESQVRPLVQLKPVEQRKVWKDFLNTGMEMTAPKIKKFIKSSRGSDKNDPADLSDQISSEYMTAVQVMLEQVCVAQHDHWQKTSRQAALLWNQVICEKILFKEIVYGKPVH
jgi:hypothetical protein